jgi:hypothetical protein
MVKQLLTTATVGGKFPRLAMRPRSGSPPAISAGQRQILPGRLRSAGGWCAELQANGVGTMLAMRASEQCGHRGQRSIALALRTGMESPSWVCSTQ